MKTSLLSLFVILLSTSSWAASSESAFTKFDQSIHAAAGFNAGGFALGGEYEYHYHRTYGVGGYARLMSKDDENGAHGYTALGGFIRPHFHRRSWDLFITAGFGLAAVDSVSAARDDETAIGPIFGTGLYYQFSRTMAFGVEQMALYGWLADDFRGQIDEHIMAKFRWGL